jgi:ribonuclease VapC
MVIDTSALVAILLAEADADVYMKAISRASERYLSSASWLELSIVMSVKRRDIGLRELDLVVARAKISVVAFTAEHAVKRRATLKCKSVGDVLS